jgi:hypothetical protein
MQRKITQSLVGSKTTKILVVFDFNVEEIVKTPTSFQIQFKLTNAISADIPQFRSFNSWQ